MAKKVTTTTEEVIDEKPDDKKDTTVEESEIDYKKDIEGKTEEQIATEKPSVEEKVEEIPPEEETETVEFDPEELKRQAKEEARQEMAALLSGKTGEEEKAVTDEYEEFVKAETAKNGKAPEWKEVAKFIKERAKAEIKADFEAEAKTTADNLKVEEDNKKLQQDGVNKYVDDQFDQLYATNQFPRMKNAEDPNDLGVVYRRALAQQTMDINKKRLDGGLPTKTLMEVYFTEFKRPDRQPAGADAPVSAGRSAATGEDAEEINYMRDIKGSRSFVDILMRKK